MDFAALIPVIRRLALEAGEAIMQVYDGEDFDVQSKGDNSPVTAADLAADAIIGSGLRAAFPDVVLITEEQADSHALQASTFLIVDPLDGTKEFIKRGGDFTVNIAYVENGVPLRGVVYAPALGRLFYTQADGQAVEEMSDGSLTRVSVRAPDNAALMVVASKSHRDAATDDYIARYCVREIGRASCRERVYCVV